MSSPQPKEHHESDGGPATDDGPKNRRSLPTRATARSVTRLQALYRRDNPAAVATLARLRQGAGRSAHDAPASWGIDGLEELAELREEERLSSGQPATSSPSRFFSAPERRSAERNEHNEEQAVHLAVTLWALHQQSIRDADMHVFGWPLGRGVRRLALGGHGTGVPSADSTDEVSDTSPLPVARAEEALSDPLRKRFVRIGTATSFESLAVRLREMVLLLRGARIPLDYGRLAHQLWVWQKEDQQASIRRAWGREFHLSYAEKKKPEPGGAAGTNGTGPSATGDEQDIHDSGE